MSLLHLSSSFCLLPVLMPDSALTWFVLIRGSQCVCRGVYACVCVHMVKACELPPSESSISFLSRQTHSEVQKSLLLDRKRASSNLSLHQSMVFPLVKVTSREDMKVIQYLNIYKKPSNLFTMQWPCGALMHNICSSHWHQLVSWVQIKKTVLLC